MVQIAIVGASGFIGSHCAQAATQAGHRIQAVAAPRLSAEATDSAGGFVTTDRGRATTERLAQALQGADVVINAAGTSQATAIKLSPELFGANALLPLVLMRASQLAGVARFVHISSAAVQGSRQSLNETNTFEPFSPYSQSKTLGERYLHQMRGEIELVRFRPTSVHGVRREVTRRLAALARSPWSSVAGVGAHPTPQVLAPNVGAAVIACAVYPGGVPDVVLQPSDGLTCRTLLTALGCGREPRGLSESLAKSIVRTCRKNEKLAAQSRRLEMLWFGQLQEPGWLTRQGWVPPYSIADWYELGAELRLASR